jgi:hypothetical protein
VKFASILGIKSCWNIVIGAFHSRLSHRSVVPPNFSFGFETIDQCKCRELTIRVAEFPPRSLQTMMHRDCRPTKQLSDVPGSWVSNKRMIQRTRDAALLRCISSTLLYLINPSIDETQIHRHTVTHRHVDEKYCWVLGCFTFKSSEIACWDVACVRFSSFEKVKSSMDRHNAAVLDQIAFGSSEYSGLMKKCAQCRLMGTTQMTEMDDVICIRGGSLSDSIEVAIHRRGKILTSERLSLDWPSNRRRRGATIIFERGIELTRLEELCFQCLFIEFNLHSPLYYNSREGMFLLFKTRFEYICV